jgi:hypothetical protein
MTEKIKFFDRSAQAYNEKKFDCRIKLKDALVHKNYLISPINIQQRVKEILDANDTSTLPDDPIYPDEPDLCLGNRMNNNKPEYVYWIGLASRVIGGNQFHPELFDTDKFLGWLNSTRRNLIWISDLKNNEGLGIGIPTADNISNILADLGLYGTRYGKDEEIILIELEVNQFYKPTLLDSGLTFFWQIEQDSDWGLTRSLRTGLPTLREWVVKKSIQNNLKVRSAKTIKCLDKIELVEEFLVADYWKECERELLAHKM